MTSLSTVPDRRMTIAEFLDFYDGRPEGEHWELVDGYAYMMTPPLIVHQLLASNLERALWDAIERLGLPFLVARECGIELPEVEGYRPEPEVTVFSAPVDPTRRHVDHFIFVAEVLSPSDRQTIAKKVAYYSKHTACRMILLAKPGEAWVELHESGPTGWTTRTLQSLDAPIDVPGIGPIGTVATLYRHVPLPT